MKNFIVAIFIALMFTGCATTTCEQRAQTWHTANKAAIEGVRIYAEPHMGNFGPRWTNVTLQVLELAKDQYLEKCKEKEKEENPPVDNETPKDGESPEGEEKE